MHRPPQPAPQPPQRRTTYVEAVALYERGLEALQRHDFADAAAQFESVLRQYPEEKELHERVRLYLNICQRQATPKETAPQTREERLYAATLAINGGRYDQALANLRLVLVRLVDEVLHPGHDLASGAAETNHKGGLGVHGIDVGHEDRLPDDARHAGRSARGPPPPHPFTQRALDDR